LTRDAPEGRRILTLVFEVAVLEAFIDGFDKMVQTAHDLCRPRYEHAPCPEERYIRH
jgi:hypothetical protein